MIVTVPTLAPDTAPLPFRTLRGRTRFRRHSDAIGIPVNYGGVEGKVAVAVYRQVVSAVVLQDQTASSETADSAADGVINCGNYHTVCVVLPEMLPEVALMTAEPAATPLARPPAATVATEVTGNVTGEIVADDQVTEDVMSCDVPSEYVPVAINCFVKPA